MNRVVFLVMDSFGIGAGPDAADYGGAGFTDEGSDTLGHIAEAWFKEKGRPLSLPNLSALGLGEAYRLAHNRYPLGWSPVAITGSFGCAREVSKGKDTPSGHWELAGVPVSREWTYFPDQPDCFPSDLLDRIFHDWGQNGSLGNCHASGTEIISRLGDEHRRTGLPIFYTSADSVFQIACHEEDFGLGRLLELCQLVRKILDESDYHVGRVIARPFTGPWGGPYARTGNRHDYAVPPPAATVLDKLIQAGGVVEAVGKIGDIFAHRGISRETRASGHEALWQETFAALDRCGDNGLVFTNFVDFDAVYGHRRDVLGYGQALEDFDARIPELLGRLGVDDLLIISADHGNDPTWPGTDHTRELVPILVNGNGVVPGRSLGVRQTFADVGQTIATFLGLSPMDFGASLL